MRQLCAILLLSGIIITTLIVTGISGVSAQSITADLSIDVVPNNPSPGQTVILKATSYGGDLDKADITWTYNNVTVAKGIGMTSVSIVAPAGGATGVVAVTANSSDFNSVTSSVVLRPASLDIIWEAADAYTPPFYKGKALLAPNGLVRFSVIPSISAPKNLSYAWSRNDSAMLDDSGYNKSSVAFTHSEFNQVEKVDVTATGGVFSGTGTLSLAPKDPSIVLYANKEGYLDYANGYTTSISFEQSGMVLHFEPYNFSVPNNLLTDLNFDLKIDGVAVDRSKSNEIGLSRPSKAGQSKLDLTVTPTAYSLQHAQRNVTLLFN